MSDLEEKRRLLAQLLEKKSRLRKVAPLSFAQERLYFLDQLQPNSSLYNLPASFRLKTRLNTAALERSLSEIVRRHEALRTTFELVDSVPAQVIHPAQPLKLQIEDVSSSPNPEAEAVRQAAIEAQEPFNLREGPLFRARLLRLQETDQVLLLTMHHIVSDGWSMVVLLRELSELYEGYSRGAPASLPDLPIQYSDFAVWQRQSLTPEVIEEQLGYWREQLTGAPAMIDLPFDRARPAVQTYRGDMRTFNIPRDVSNRLLRLGQGIGATLFMTVLAAFQVFLARYSGQWDVVVGTPVANRSRTELEGIIGFFVNTLVLRTRMEDDPTFVELLRRVKQMTADAYAHQDLPFEKLVDELQTDRVPSHNPLFQVMFSTDVRPEVTRTSARAPSASGKWSQAGTGGSKFDLGMNVSETPAGLAGLLEFNTDLFQPSTIERMIANWQVLLDAIACDPNERVSRFNLLSAQERRPPNSAFDILDRHLNPVPIGVIGELFAAADGGADGNFLPDPYSPDPGARMYRTGDLARFLPDGNVDVIGRVDRHVKVQGMRVNLAEVEAALRQIPGVQDAIATAHEFNPGELRLVGYLAGEVQWRSSSKALRRELTGKLPAYMMPSEFMWLDQLPVDSVGETDRSALPIPTASQPERDFSAPANPLEEVMAGIWSELIGIERVGRDDGFFEIGGHSLLATQLCSRIIDMFDVMIPLQQVFEVPTLAEFCSLVLDESDDRQRTEKIAELMLSVAAMPDAELPAAH